jgi:hypothetical protein
MQFRLAGILMLTCALVGGFPALAQRSGGGLNAEQPNIGQVETHIEKYDQALGVVTRLSRPLGAETECYGTCFLPNSSQSTSWRCAPKETCDLHCNVNPPVGGCR